MTSTDAAHGFYYVSAIDGSWRYLVAGPYAKYEEALARVDAVLGEADRRDGRAWFMTWGTARTDRRMETPLGTF